MARFILKLMYNEIARLAVTYPEPILKQTKEERNAFEKTYEFR